jgi:hypothetical protein
MEMPSLLGDVRRCSPFFSWPRVWDSVLSYGGGLLVFLFHSVVGVWLIVRAFKKDTKFLHGLLKVPPWLLAISGVLLQVPAVIYIYLGIRAGFFSF